jgi:hypothetical protein
MTRLENTITLPILQADFFHCYAKGKCELQKQKKEKKNNFRKWIPFIQSKSKPKYLAHQTVVAQF